MCKTSPFAVGMGDYLYYIERLIAVTTVTVMRTEGLGGCLILAQVMH